MWIDLLYVYCIHGGDVGNVKTIQLSQSQLYIDWGACATQGHINFPLMRLRLLNSDWITSFKSIIWMMRFGSQRVAAIIHVLMFERDWDSCTSIFTASHSLFSFFSFPSDIVLKCIGFHTFSIEAQRVASARGRMPRMEFHWNNCCLYKLGMKMRKHSLYAPLSLSPFIWPWVECVN